MSGFTDTTLYRLVPWRVVALGWVAAMIATAVLVAISASDAVVAITMGGVVGAIASLVVASAPRRQAVALEASVSARGSGLGAEEMAKVQEAAMTAATTLIQRRKRRAELDEAGADPAEADLTPAEMEVLEAFAGGGTVREIAARLGVAERTALALRFSALRKVGESVVPPQRTSGRD